MTETPRRYAQHLAGEAEIDFASLQRKRAEIDGRLSKFSETERREFQSELQRLLRRHELTKSQPNFKRSWKSTKD